MLFGHRCLEVEDNFNFHSASTSLNIAFSSLTYPFAVYFIPWSTDANGVGTMLVKYSGSRQVTLPFPLIKIESAHLDAMSVSFHQNFYITYNMSISAEIATSRSASDVI